MNDAINALFELAGAFFIGLSVKKLYKDKSVRGLHWAQVAFFTCWGYWNIVYYPAIKQQYSFLAGIAVVLVNSVYLGMIFHYRRR